MRTTSLSCFVLAVLSLAACSSETGILINASTSDDLASEVASLRFYVGEDMVSEYQYFSDEDPLEDVVLGGRNIAEDPFSLLVRPGNEEAEVVIAILAYDEEGKTIGFGRLPTPVRFLSGKVLEWDVPIGRVPSDVFEADYECLKWLDEAGEFVHIGRPGDADCDGVQEGVDCDDHDPNRYPGNVEQCDNNIDDDCNGLADAEDDLSGDADNDGYAACGDSGQRDCNNSDPNVHPGATETCNGIDDDCDGACDNDFDSDSDGVTSCGSILSGNRCVSMGAPDCAPNNPDRYPRAEEICDGIDNDCNQVCDDNPDLDYDSDGYTECGSIIGRCGVSDAFIDCEPDDFYTHPGAQEFCDGFDNNCDGTEDPERTPCFEGDGPSCRQGSRECDLGGGPPSECALEDTTVASSVCESFDECLELDPFVCVLEGDGIGVESNEGCRVGLGGDSQCDDDTVLIQTPDGITGESCVFTLIGGHYQQGYVVSLLGPQSGDEKISVESCAARLRVEPGPAAGVAHLLINYSSAVTEAHVIEVKVTPEVYDTCEGVLGLSCNEWETLSDDVMPSP